MSGLFGGGSSNTTTSKSEPWKAAQPYLQQGFKYGGQLLDQSAANPQAYAGPRVAGFSQPSQMGLDATVQTAMQGNPLAQNAVGAVNSITGGQGINQNMLNATAGANSVATGQTGANAISNNLSGIAAGQNLGGANPYLDQAIQGQQQSTLNQIKAASSAQGRYGSGAMGAKAGAALGQIGINAKAQNYENEANRMMQANQMQSGEQLANIGNMTNAGMGLADMFGQGQTRALQGAGIGSAVNDLRYGDQQRLMQAGSAYDTQKQQQLDALQSQYNENRDIPWQQFQQFGNTIGGVASPYGTQTQTSPGQSPITSALGGAMTGGGMFGPLGAMAGGALGLFGGFG
jgi:hypothetical protein